MGEVVRLGPVLESIDRARAAAAERGDEYAASEFAKEREERLRKLDQSGCRVTDEMRKAIAFGCLGETSARRAIDAWVADRSRRPWLIISGGTGCGKSIALAELHARYRGKYARADDVVRTFSALWDSADAQKQMRDTRLLTLDDLGTEFDLDRMQPALLELLDARAAGATVVTTNLSREQFAARYSHERILSRLSERVRWVTVQGQDLRRARPK